MCQPEHEESAPQFALRLKNYLVRWIELADVEKTYDGLKDLLLREQFISASQEDLALFLKERNPVNVKLMADLAEQYLEAHGSLDMIPKKAGFGSGKTFIPATKPGMSSKPSGRSLVVPPEKSNSNRVC